MKFQFFSYNYLFIFFAEGGGMIENMITWYFE